MAVDMKRDLSGLLHPSSVVVVGASAAPHKIGGVLFANVAAFPGPVYAVNPGYREVLGRPCVPTVDALPEPVGLAVIVVSPDDALRALEACGRKGIPHAVVITAGFKEQGGQGIERERELVRIASEYGMNVVGPNAFGVVFPRVGLNATFAPRGALPGHIAFISQSGALGSGVLNWAWHRKLGFSAFVSVGNKAVLTETDFLTAFAHDPDTKVIAAYLEAIEDGEAFLRVVEEVTREKPVLVLKAGRTEVGARAASSHTGALAGSDRAYDAAFRRSGVIRVRTVEELFEGAVALAQQPAPRGRRLGIVTNAGGPGILAADAAADDGLELAPLSPGTVASLANRFSSAASAANPVDILADATAEGFRDAVEWVLADPNVDMGLVLTAPHPILTFTQLAGDVAAAHLRQRKPVAASFMAGDLGPEAERVLRDAGVPAYFEPSRAVRALATLVRYREIRDRPPREVRDVKADRARAREILATGRTRLGVEAVELLAAYGIPVARGGLARSAAEAVALARDVGGPVVLKLVAPEVVHKSDVGGVRIGVPPSRVRSVYRELAALLPDRPGVGVYVQELLPPGEEVIVGVSRDPTFGPLVMFGLGGVFVEVLDDVAFSLAPLSPREAEDLVRRIKGFPVLAGLRGRPPVFLGGLAEVVERVSHLAADFPEIQELDINPLLCYPSRVVAVDLRVTVGA
ncbi:MAG: Acetyl-CoA synthetase [Candidatus Bipolaricaulis sibiricus]|uniref:Acetyl-CoA synthetase n=1 Tax=Bipolaricaulis sibiricus TaxID=2501609 RepID=A0A410FTD9_BIPS1|nr:MAG: Acetyl-CoA synthetase [Candidatus Bipolaricaulis sibiricus]